MKRLTALLILSLIALNSFGQAKWRLSTTVGRAVKGSYSSLATLHPSITTNGLNINIRVDYLIPISKRSHFIPVLELGARTYGSYKNCPPTCDRHDEYDYYETHRRVHYANLGFIIRKPLLTFKQSAITGLLGAKVTKPLGGYYRFESFKNEQRVKLRETGGYPITDNDIYANIGISYQRNVDKGFNWFIENSYDIGTYDFGYGTDFNLNLTFGITF